VVIVKWSPGNPLLTRLTNRGDRHKVVWLRSGPRKARISKLRIVPSELTLPYASLRADAIRADLITCESRVFSILQQADQVSQALAEPP
jgi:hypothetical protein